QVAGLPERSGGRLDLAIDAPHHIPRRAARRPWNTDPTRMAKETNPSPTRSEAGLRRDWERRARLSEALRDNLLKRKAQQRARAGGDPVGAQAGDATGEGAAPKP